MLQKYSSYSLYIGTRSHGELGVDKEAASVSKTKEKSPWESQFHTKAGISFAKFNSWDCYLQVDIQDEYAFSTALKYFTTVASNPHVHMTLLKRQLKIANIFIASLTVIVKFNSSDIVASHLPHQPL